MIDVKVRTIVVPPEPTDPAPQLTLPEEAGRVFGPEDVIVEPITEDGERVFRAFIHGLPIALATDVSSELALRRLAALLGSFVKGHAWIIKEMQARFAEEGILAGEAEAPAGALMSFSSALGLLKAGKRIKRLGWSDAFVAYQPGYPDGIPINANTAKAMGRPEGTVVNFLPYLMLHGAASGSAADTDGRRACVPWLPSMHALFADDWQVAE